MKLIIFYLCSLYATDSFIIGPEYIADMEEKFRTLSFSEELSEEEGSQLFYHYSSIDWPVLRESKGLRVPKENPNPCVYQNGYTESLESRDVVAFGTQRLALEVAQARFSVKAGEAPREIYLYASLGKNFQSKFPGSSGYEYSATHVNLENIPFRLIAKKMGLEGPISDFKKTFFDVNLAFLEKNFEVIRPLYIDFKINRSGYPESKRSDLESFYKSASVIKGAMDWDRDLARIFIEDLMISRPELF